MVDRSSIDILKLDQEQSQQIPKQSNSNEKSANDILLETISNILKELNTSISNYDSGITGIKERKNINKITFKKMNDEIKEITISNRQTIYNNIVTKLAKIEEKVRKANNDELNTSYENVNNLLKIQMKKMYDTLISIDNLTRIKEELSEKIKTFFGQVYNTLSKNKDYTYPDSIDVFKDFLKNEIEEHINKIKKYNEITHTYKGSCLKTTKNIKVILGGRKSRKLKNYK